METLTDISGHPERRGRAIDSCCALLDAEVNSKTGAIAFGVKKAYGAVSKLESGNLIRNVFDKLFDEFIEELDPFYQNWVAAGGTPGFGDYLEERDEQVAEALLRVTDRERDRVDSRVLVLTYNSLRGVAMKLVRPSIRPLGDMMQNHFS